MTQSTFKNNLIFLMALFAGSSFLSSAVAGNAEGIKLNDKGYFEIPGLNILVFENAYTGMFIDEKTAGIMLIHHGVRTATGGAVRLKPTPEQWDQIPTLVNRTVNQEDNSVEIVLRYKDFNFDSRVRVESEGLGVKISVYLETPLPQKLEGRAGFNLEFLPSAYFGKTYMMDEKAGLFPLYPSSTTKVLPADTQLRQYMGHSTSDDRGRGEYIEPESIAEGTTLVLAPEDPERCVKIQSLSGGNLMLLDGRNVAQNGWFVVRTVIPSGKTGKVIQWLLAPTVLPNWIRKPVIGYSQVGYHPKQEKVAVIELDQNDIPLKSAALLKLNDRGQWLEVFKDDTKDWGKFLRYRYIRFDFSKVRDAGLYCIQYGSQKTDVFRIGAYVYNETWQPTLDVWFPVQMDHMFVNEAYRVWHGAAHLDDARQAPLNHQHFDGYESGVSTETQYKPGEHIPGLDIGGWFDAGDFDIQTGSHCTTLQHLVSVWEQFGLKRDETFIDQEHRYVDIHRPDGKPDILQQIEHGTLALIAQYRAFGRTVRGIVQPNLHQYHHLGDGSTITDNLPYDPNLKIYESNGVSSGTPDDRWVFTSRSPGMNYASIAALAGASRALRGFNNPLAEECLATAKNAWADEQKQSGQINQRDEGFRGSGDMQALLQLYIATNDKQYAERFQRQIWDALDQSLDRNIRLAAQAVPFMDQAYKKKLAPFVEKYKAASEELLSTNPYGVPITNRGWAGNNSVIDWAVTNYVLHRNYPEIIGPEYTCRGLNYIYGCHPYSNLSFVSGVGLHSKDIAYGSNRADFSFIAGGVVPGILLIKPDFPENKNDWPFLWGENEYVIDICANYILLVNAVMDLVDDAGTIRRQ